MAEHELASCGITMEICGRRQKAMRVVSYLQLWKTGTGKVEK
jgi:hypothetical protein